MQTSFPVCLAKIHVSKLILQPQQYCTYTTSKFVSFSSKLHVLWRMVENSYSTPPWPLAQKVWQGNYNLAMWESDPQRNCKMRGETKIKKSLCFPGSHTLSFTSTKEIFLLLLEEICQICLDLNPLAIAKVRLEFWGLAALLVGNCIYATQTHELQTNQYKWTSKQNVHSIVPKWQYLNLLNFHFDICNSSEYLELLNSYC